jgi:cytochrome P450 family 6
VTRDPDIIKHVLVKDFSIFADRHTSTSKSDTLGAQNMFTLNGEPWKYLRMKLSPTFTSGRMKKMFPLIVNCATEFMDYLQNHSEEKEPVEVKEVTAKFSTGVISTCAFGIISNSIHNPKAEFREFGRKIFHFTWFRTIEVLGLFFCPSLISFLNGRFFSEESTEFLRKAFWDVINYRERNKITRDDFLDLLIQLRNKGHIEGVETEQMNGLKEDRNSTLFGKMCKK